MLATRYSPEAEERQLRQLAEATLPRLLDAPLYTPVEVPVTRVNNFARQLRILDIKLDLYCPTCCQQSTFHTLQSDATERMLEQERVDAATVMTPAAMHRPPVVWAGDFQLRLRCGRVDRHISDFHFRTELHPLIEMPNGDKKAPNTVSFVKFGQWPSLTDFQVGNLTPLEEGLSKLQRKEFVRAINCAAHGFNVAACVYYRRVFESVMDEAREKCMEAKGMKEWPEYQSAASGERIQLLVGFLPEFMTEHPHLYRILSIGVHQLTEEDCKKEMPMLRQAMELIFEDKVAQVRKEKQRLAVSKMLSQSSSALGTSGPQQSR